MSPKSNGTLNVQRRTWNLDKYKSPHLYDSESDNDETEEREPLNQQVQKDEIRRDKRPLPEAQLKHLTVQKSQQSLSQPQNLINQRRIITSETALADRGGFYCDVCKVLLRDNAAYLEHINKKSHQMRLGLETKVRTATHEEVLERLSERRERWIEEKRRKREEKLNQTTIDVIQSPADVVIRRREELLIKMKHEEEYQRQRKKEIKQRRKQRLRQQQHGENIEQQDDQQIDVNEADQFVKESWTNGGANE